MAEPQRLLNESDITYRHKEVFPKVYMGGPLPTILVMAFACPHCGDEQLYRASDLCLLLGATDDCDACGGSFAWPAFHCRLAGCRGTYSRCGGTLRRRTRPGGYQMEKDWHMECDACGHDEDGFGEERRCRQIVCDACGNARSPYDEEAS